MNKTSAATQQKHRQIEPWHQRKPHRGAPLLWAPPEDRGPVYRVPSRLHGAGHTLLYGCWSSTRCLGSPWLPPSVHQQLKPLIIKPSIPHLQGTGSRWWHQDPSGLPVPACDEDRRALPVLMGPGSCGTARGDGHGVQVTSLFSREGNPGLSKQPRGLPSQTQPALAF